MGLACLPSAKIVYPYLLCMYMLILLYRVGVLRCQTIKLNPKVFNSNVFDDNWKKQREWLKRPGTLDTFQDCLIAEHMKPRMHILEISISSLNHVIVRPTKTPKLADKKCA